MKKILTILSSFSLVAFTTTTVVSCTGVEKKLNYSGDHLKELLKIDEALLSSIEKTSQLVNLIKENISKDTQNSTENIKNEYEINVSNETKNIVSAENYDTSKERRYVKVIYKEILSIEGKDQIELESEHASFALINI